MFVLHGTWIPAPTSGFDNRGNFYLWVETHTPMLNQSGHRRRSPHRSALHPCHLPGEQLIPLFQREFPVHRWLAEPLTSIDCYFTLPSSDEEPLPCPQIASYLGVEMPERFAWRQWQVSCLQPAEPLEFLKQAHFLSLQNGHEVWLGSDLSFWYRYSRALSAVFKADQYIPALKCRRPSAAKVSPSRSRRRQSTSVARGSVKGQLDIVPAWEIISSRYESTIANFGRELPVCCGSGSLAPNGPGLFEGERLLRHFSEQALETLVAATPFTQKSQNQVQGTFIHHCLFANAPGRRSAPMLDISQQTWQEWQLWRQRLVATQTGADFILCLRLHSAAQGSPNDWPLELLVESKQDPSLKVALHEYWQYPASERARLKRFLGQDFEKALLLALGEAARIFPKLWEGLETDRPSGVSLNAGEAWQFLKESALILEDAGHKVIVPAWWTPEGRQRARLRVQVSAARAPAQAGTGSALTLASLVDYRYELAIGEQVVSPEEWQALVAAKTPLVHFRGEWMEVDGERMAKMLALWHEQGPRSLQMPVLDMFREATQAEAGDDYQYHYAGAVAEMMARLEDKSRLELVPTPAGLCGVLREYQQRGVAWLRYLEELGMGPCLADDMGLGKTVQVIARLVQEREGASVTASSPGPTLLVAPTSVLGNWQKEIERFAPQLKVFLHHGAGRAKQQAALASTAASHDVLLTSFALARKDAALLQPIRWHRVVIDEAQNIKNPKSAQARALFKLNAARRLALTGTPIENRLLDLWSIFRFLNPGYLGTEGQFRKTFETPIQRESDAVRSSTLKALVGPFLLRRLKTDKTVLKDLPDKIEQKVYCNLSQEQASLYQAVVDQVGKPLEQAEGMARRGLILSTLMRLKQICNHPAQFLQDGSGFSEERSHKLARVVQMIEEVITEGESLLLFTQFTEIGDALEQHLRSQYHYNTFYLHGGTARSRRQKMIETFQDPETPPSIFVLSLKAGGVGITLTKANHVFHFDRWWNPAVENQATDRAFRIGQQKKVFVHKLVTLGTLEERIDHMLEEKQKLQGIVGHDESWLTELDNEAFRRLIDLSQSAVL
ncbi:MAG: DEAD/DEAH box helicase [Gammaproteobacteria bacterium]